MSKRRGLTAGFAPLLALLMFSLLFIGCGRGALPAEIIVKKNFRPLAMVRIDDEIWVATRMKGIYRIGPCSGKSPRIARRLELGSDQQRAHWIAAARGSVWIATDGGLIRYSPEKDRIIAVWTGKQGLPSNSVRWVGEIGGDIWAGTIRGASRLGVDGKWRNFGDAQGLPSLHVYRMIEDKDGIWASCISGGLARWVGGLGRWEAVPIQRGLGNKYIYAMAGSQSGLWLGTAGGVNLYSAAANGWDETVCRDGFTDYCVYAIVPVGDDLWFATNYGLYRREIKSGRQYIYGKSEGLPSDETSALLAEPGRLWVGTSAGVALINTTKL